jgi:hypothetical protein
MMIKPGEEIIAGSNQHFLVVAVVAFEEEDQSPFAGLLRVEAAWQRRGRHLGRPRRGCQQVDEKLSNDTVTVPLGVIVMCSVSLTM